MGFKLRSGNRPNIRGGLLSQPCEEVMAIKIEVPEAEVVEETTPMNIVSPLKEKDDGGGGSDDGGSDDGGSDDSGSDDSGSDDSGSDTTDDTSTDTTDDTTASTTEDTTDEELPVGVMAPQDDTVGPAQPGGEVPVEDTFVAAPAAEESQEQQVATVANATEAEKIQQQEVEKEEAADKALEEDKDVAERAAKKAAIKATQEGGAATKVVSKVVGDKTAKAVTDTANKVLTAKSKIKNAVVDQIQQRASDLLKNPQTASKMTKAMNIAAKAAKWGGRAAKLALRMNPAIGTAMLLWDAGKAIKHTYDNRDAIRGKMKQFSNNVSNKLDEFRT